MSMSSLDIQLNHNDTVYDINNFRVFFVITHLNKLWNCSVRSPWL